MDSDLLIVGGGIAGLAAALATARAGARVRLLEQASAWGEVGAGLQLGPNAVRVLDGWGLRPALNGCAAYPDALRVRDSRSGHELGRLALGARARARYGQPYATVHRADLHTLLLQAAQAQPGVQLCLGSPVQQWQATGDGVSVSAGQDEPLQALALLGCDGVWSRVRQQLLCDGPPPATGHLAYRGLVHQADWPAPLRQSGVTAWLGPRHHVVHYPVRGGDWLNVVAVVHGRLDRDCEDWAHQASLTGLRAALGEVHRDLQNTLDAVPGWTLWPLHDRAPLVGPHQMARGRVALLGDAAHPMRPYLAQGAAMALEDAWALGHALGEGWRDDVSVRLAAWAQRRWQRNAWVQARSRRNGRVFHLQGPLRWARNVALSVGGERVMDVPALYAGPPAPFRMGGAPLA